MSAPPPSSDQSMVQGRATTVSTTVPTSRPYAMTPRGPVPPRPRRRPGRTGRSSRPGSRRRPARAAARRRRSFSPDHTWTTHASPPTARTTPSAAARVTGRRCTNRTQPSTSAGARYSTSSATPTGIREIAASTGLERPPRRTVRTRRAGRGAAVRERDGARPAAASPGRRPRPAATPRGADRAPPRSAASPRHPIRRTRPPTQREAQPDALPTVVLTALRGMHLHMMTGHDMSVTPNGTCCLSDWTEQPGSPLPTYVSTSSWNSHANSSSTSKVFSMRSSSDWASTPAPAGPRRPATADR